MTLGVQRLVTESVAFQRERGVDNRHDAAEHVYLFSDEVSDPDEIKQQRPFACLWPSGLSWRRITGGSSSGLRPSGSVTLLLTANDTAGSDVDETDADLAFAAWIDGVVNDIAELAGQDDRVRIREISGSDPLVRRSAAKDAPGGVYLWSQFEISWGDE